MKGMKRNIGTFALMMTGLGSIIGSGWLFGAWKAASVAGPAAIWAWVIGMIAIMFIGLTYAELGAMFPEAGGMVRYGHYSHGSFLGFISGWANWIAIVSVIPVEAVASIQYMSSWPWAWAKALYNGETLSPVGLVLAACLVVVYFLINYWTVKLFARVNTAITVFKFLIPGLTIIGLIYAGFHANNFTHAPGGFTPNGWAGVLTAVATSGIVFAFNGFQSPINMAGEAKNPSRSVPIAVAGSILLAGIIYVLLQTAYIGAVPDHLLAKGWGVLNFSSPFADLALALNLNWLALLLFADAFVSPSGTGMTYTATTARMIYGMEQNGYFPRIFGKIHPVYGVPRPAMWFNLAVSFLFLFIFRGWGSLAEVISVATLISYVTGPISVMVFRRMKDVNVSRPLKIKGMPVIAPLAFIVASLILYWATWPLTGQVTLIMIIGLPVYFYYQAKNNWKDFAANFKAGLWLVVYLIVMMGISYLGSSKFGGTNHIPYGMDMVVVVIAALIFYFWGIRSALPSYQGKQDEQSNEQMKIAN
ncbi:APC family permease [Thermoactinomyces daqus]|uniref:APC family permease n=1 Tax=Thermoactinomyces daqus TaxID=1329516 RepID=A0A7W1X7T6_9BACL|nr:APC family permease [Thermoactinomyces daqus]MBA4541660.1 APC family permease [Thermoactinomyces daqus]